MEAGTWTGRRAGRGAGDGGGRRGRGSGAHWAATRGRALLQSWVALAHLRGRDLEQAAASGRDALRGATDVSSTMLVQRLRTLHRHIQPVRAGSPHLRELDDQLTTFLTRDNTRS
ncbi:MAG: hypothetical protein ACRDTE_30280 [Pseudonocardiaceae bacterium]